MASAFFPKVFQKVLEGELDLSGSGDTVKVMLLGNVASYTYDVTDEFVSDLVSAELSTVGTGYSRKVIPVSLSFDADAGNSGAQAGCFINFQLTTTGSDNAIWTDATFTTAHAVMFVDKGGPDSGNPLLYYFDLTADQIVSSGTFELRNPTTQPKIRRV